MIKKMKKNALLVAIVATLFGLGAKNVASAAQVASVPSTRYEIWYVYGGSRTTYTWRNLSFRNGYSYSTTSKRQDYGINPGYLYTSHYTTY